MINPIMKTAEAGLFDRLQGKAPEIKQGIDNLKSIGLTQKDVILNTIARNINSTEPETVAAIAKFLKGLQEGELTKTKFSQLTAELNPFLANDAAMKETSQGIAVMAEGWSKPIVFPNKGAFKFLGWADKPAEVTTEGLWKDAYGENIPALKMGAVGNSNIKPEQVRGGCDLTKKELSAKYEKAIIDFYNPIFDYLKEQGAKAEDIGMAFAHSDCGVDRAAREVIEKQGLKGFAVTPHTYTQYLRGTEMPATAEFPNGYVLADFPFPTVLTRNVGQVEDYATVYGKMVGKGNPLGVFGGGEHAFARDAREAVIGVGESQAIPVDIMKDKFGVVIPATIKNELGKDVVTNAARDMLERVDANPYEQFRYTFKNVLPNSKLKEDIAQYDPQAAIATAAYTKLAQAGKIGK